MMSNPIKWKKSPYYGKTPDEIKAGWDRGRDEAAAAGTAMHQCIENFYLGDSNTDLPPHFMDFVKDHPDLQPYRTEWMIFDEEVKIAGSIDMVVGVAHPGVYPLVIYDWKRCKEIKQSNDFKEFASTECIKHLPDTNFWHYSLQLNIYKAILERKYDKKVAAMYLVCLHPSLSSYQLFPVPDLAEEVAALFALRKTKLFQ
jgi:ATP-dependent exoDNAse (exonuclease V) beta subunit